ESFVRLSQHGGGPATITSLPGNVAAEKPRVGGARVCLYNVCKVLACLRNVALCKRHLATQDEGASLLGVELQPRVECLAGRRKLASRFGCRGQQFALALVGAVVLRIDANQLV